MRRIQVPPAIQQELPDAVIQGLNEMLIEAHDIAYERFEHRLAQETGKLRLDFAEMKYDLVKWSFLFWLGQVALLGGLLLRGR